MVLQVRKPDLTRLDREGIPLDFLATMEMFNTLLARGLLSFIPRKFPITKDEIKKYWMPHAGENIAYIADQDGRRVAAGTLIEAQDSNLYSIQADRKKEYALTQEPDFQEAGLEVTRRVIREAKEHGNLFILHTSIENKNEIEIMRKLGYNPINDKPRHYERYAHAGINPAVWIYLIE